MINPKVYILVGLPGSGKTFVGNRMAEQMNIPFLDDIKDLRPLIDKLVKGEDVIIADPNLCWSDNREAAQRIFNQHNVKTEWYFFENVPQRCRDNVKYRNDGRLVDGLITMLANQYEIPKDARILDVWEKPSENPRDDLDNFRLW